MIAQSLAPHTNLRRFSFFGTMERCSAVRNGTAENERNGKRDGTGPKQTRWDQTEQYLTFIEPFLYQKPVRLPLL